MISINDKDYDVVTLDFETYWASDYSLGKSSKMNTTEYIRDDRFYAYGVGIKINDGETKWVTGKDIAEELNGIDWGNTALLAHNTAFDGAILSEHYGIYPAFMLDTLSMSRPVHGHHVPHNLDYLAKLHGFGGKVHKEALTEVKGKRELTDVELHNLGIYCIDDVNDTYSVFQKMYDYISDDELKIIDITIKMFTDPVLSIDKNLAQEALNEERAKKVAAVFETGVQEEILRSNNKFAELLKSMGCEPPMKISPTTGKETYAFAKNDEGFIALLNSDNERIAKVARARKTVRSSQGESRAERFLKTAEMGDTLPVFLNYSGAHTHRWSGGNKMNLQNLKRGGKLRRAILAPEGYSVVVADSSQIEARTLAWLAGQEDVVTAFAEKRDLYSEFGSKLFGYPVNRKKPLMNDNGEFLDKDGNVVDADNAYYPHKKEGFVGKVCVLGLGYGMSANKLRHTLATGAMGAVVNLTEQEANAAVDLYRRSNFNIVKYWRQMDSVLEQMVAGRDGAYGPLSWGKGYIRLPDGMLLHYHDLRNEPRMTEWGTVRNNFDYQSRNNSRSYIYGGMLTENVTQALARAVIAEQILKIAKEYRVVTMTHDEIVVIAKNSEAQECLDFMIDVMSTPPEWAKGLPLAAEGGYDDCYSK